MIWKFQNSPNHCFWVMSQPERNTSCRDVHIFSQASFLVPSLHVPLALHRLHRRQQKWNDAAWRCASAFPKPQGKRKKWWTVSQLYNHHDASLSSSTTSSKSSSTTTTTTTTTTSSSTTIIMNSMHQDYHVNKHHVSRSSMFHPYSFTTSKQQPLKQTWNTSIIKHQHLLFPNSLSL